MKKGKISTESIVNRIEDILASDVDDEKIMMSIAQGQYYSLDPVASRVWELIQKPVMVSDLIDALLLKYDIDRETCEGDVLTFLEDLNEKGILEVDRQV
jgi:hypothetical protein